MRTQKQQQGFVSLFTVLLVSVLLAMSVGIANIAQKQARLSSMAGDGARAFYVADAMVECLLFYTLQSTATPANFYTGAGTITCQSENDVEEEVQYAQGGNGEIVFRGEIIPEHPERIPMIDGCATVTFKKIIQDAIEYTQIESRGYNVACDQIDTHPSVVERALRVTF